MKCVSSWNSALRHANGPAAVETFGKKSAASHADGRPQRGSTCLRRGFGRQVQEESLKMKVLRPARRCAQGRVHRRPQTPGIDPGYPTQLGSCHSDPTRVCAENPFRGCFLRRRSLSFFTAPAEAPPTPRNALCTPFCLLRTRKERHPAGAYSPVSSAA
jgi:hypothetical protein